MIKGKDYLVTVSGMAIKGTYLGDRQVENTPNSFFLVGGEVQRIPAAKLTDIKEATESDEDFQVVNPGEFLLEAIAGNVKIDG